MPRRARTYIPGLPYHIVQRGNNREACFIEPENYQYYLGLWKTCAKRYGVSVHAYCLMTNHIHFMVSKPEEYKWSSYMVNAWSKESALIHHEEYLRLDKEKEARCYT
jgi:putative transposase